jgi:outer membrane protein OmpA-like peptidoglycan-associated protein/Tol biopolymer transport system component
LKQPLHYIFIFLLCFLTKAHSQSPLPPGEYTSKNKKAIRYLEEGRRAYELKNDELAEKNFKKALETDANFIEAAIGLANLYQVTNHHDEAIVFFKRAIEINPKFFPNNFYFLSLSQLAIGEYGEAKTNLEVFLKFERINPNTKENAVKQLRNATFGAEAVKSPKPYKLVNVGEGINTGMNEYFPSVTVDGDWFLFTRGVTDAQYPGYENEDFYMSQKQNGIWQTAQPIREINSIGNEGAPTLSADGTIMFFASCANEFGDYGAQDRKGYGSCDIFYAQKINGRWTKPKNAGPSINTNHWETQPSFSSDGKSLYFIRGIINRGGIKDQDIYVSTLDESGRFSPAVKLPGKVNTSGKEESVFIHPDNQTLYFSSDGHPGMGGLDIFMSKRQPNGEWGEAINLGYPLNTLAEDNSFLVYPNGKYAFKASDQKGGFGGLDIYQFELPEELKPERMTYVKGKVYNAKTKESLESSFELYDLETQLQVTQSYSQKNGEFLVTLTANKNYMVNVNKSGYLFYSDNFSLKGESASVDKPFQLDIPLEPLDVGSTVELKNIFFEVNKWELKPESRSELNKLISFLTQNKTVRIELSGHTDNTGDKKLNETLSHNRAKAVYDFLIIEGKVAPERLTYKGYGDTKPKVPNDTPENKARNRRTEFSITAR